MDDLQKKLRSIFDIAQQAGCLFQSGYSFEDYLELPVSKASELLACCTSDAKHRSIQAKYSIARYAFEALEYYLTINDAGYDYPYGLIEDKIRYFHRLATQKLEILRDPANFEYPAPCKLPARDYSKKFL